MGYFYRLIVHIASHKRQNLASRHQNQPLVPIAQWDRTT